MIEDRPIRHRRFGRLAAVPLLIALVGTLLSTGVVAAAGGTTIVRGVQQAAGTCGGDGYLMTGSLTGCWWIVTFESTTDPDHANFRATGTEHFQTEIRLPDGDQAEGFDDVHVHRRLADGDACPRRGCANRRDSDVAAVPPADHHEGPRVEQ